MATLSRRVVLTSAGNNFIDWRGQKIAPITPPRLHGTLSGLNNDDHAQYLTVAGRPGEITTMRNVDGPAKTITIACAISSGAMTFTNDLAPATYLQ